MTPVAQTERGPSTAPTDLLRAVAHELRQPLSNIESIAYYLGLLLPSASENVHRQLAHIRELIEQSNWILSSGLNLSSPGAISPESVDLEELVTKCTTAHPLPTRRRYNLELAGLPPLQLDPSQARAMVDSLLVLFHQIAPDSTLVTIRTCFRPPDGAVLELVAASARYESETSLGTGCALAIESVRRMAGMYGGRLECSVEPGSQVRLRLTLAT